MKNDSIHIPQPMRIPASYNVRMPVMHKSREDMREAMKKLRKFHTDEISTIDMSFILGVTDAQVRDFIRKGFLKAEKKGFHWAIPKDEAEKFIRSVITAD